MFAPQRVQQQATTIRYSTSKTSGTAPSKNIRYSTRQRHQAQHQAKTSGTAPGKNNQAQAPGKTSGTARQQQTIRHGTKQRHQAKAPGKNNQARHQAKTSGTAPGKDIRHSTRQKHQVQHQAKTSGTAPGRHGTQQQTIRHSSSTKQQHQSNEIERTPDFS
ncbi:MAG TPA: hypothetical protein VKU19_18920 [Bryobacteraceae bacterium]|nr:hypothetical protein [Bryobacteraceae bacterium]